VGLLFGWLGFQIQIWTVLWHIRTLTDLPLALGAVGIVRAAPTLLLSLPAGLTADTRNRRMVLLATQGTMGIVSAGLALLAGTQNTLLWLVYLLIGVQAVAFTYDLPARQSMIPNLVPARDLPNALSTEVIAYQAGAFLGPLISGAVLAAFSTGSAFILSTLCFGGMLMMLIWLGPVPQQVIPARKQSDWPSIKEGIGFTIGHPLILPSMLLDFFATLFVRADTLMPIIARDLIGTGEVGYGLLSSAQAMGASVVGLTFSTRPAFRKPGKLLLASVGMMGLGTVLFGSTRQLGLAISALALVGGADTLSSIIRSSIRQLETPDAMRGRMTGVNQVFFMGGPQLGELKSGLLGQWLGIPATLIVGGTACLLSTAWIARRWPGLASYQGIHKEHRDG
jgi:MFS family permease